VAGLAVAGALTGEEPQWAGAYDPGRLAGLLGSVGGLSDLATEIGCVRASGLRGPAADCAGDCAADCAADCAVWLSAALTASQAEGGLG
jgi:hypothetical protein